MNGRPRVVTFIIVLCAGFGSLMLAFSMLPLLNAVQMNAAYPGPSRIDFTYYLGAISASLISFVMFGWLIWTAALFARTRIEAIASLERWLRWQWYIFAAGLAILCMSFGLSIVAIESERGAGIDPSPVISFAMAFFQSTCCCGLGPIVAGHYAVYLANLPEVRGFLDRAEWGDQSEAS